MADKGKLPIVLLVILILVSLSLAGGVFYLLQQERAKNSDLQQQLSDVKKSQIETAKKLAESQRLVSVSELNLKEARDKIDMLGNDLQQEKTAKIEALARIEQLRVDLEQQKTLRSDLEKKFSQAQKDTEKSQAQLKELESKKIELEKKVKDLESQSQGVELGKIVVSPEVTPSPSPSVEIKSTKEKPTKGQDTGLEGKIIVINKDYNFAVINLGSKDGVGMGDQFSIYHNNKYIGDIKVEKVHDSMAAAGFVAADLKDKVSEGDKVLRKGK